MEKSSDEGHYLPPEAGLVQEEEPKCYQGWIIRFGAANLMPIVEPLVRIIHWLAGLDHSRAQPIEACVAAAHDRPEVCDVNVLVIDADL